MAMHGGVTIVVIYWLENVQGIPEACQGTVRQRRLFSIEGGAWSLETARDRSGRLNSRKKKPKKQSQGNTCLVKNITITSQVDNLVQSVGQFIFSTATFLPPCIDDSLWYLH